MTESAYELLGIRKDFPKELARRADEVVDPELDVRLGGSLRELSKMAGSRRACPRMLPGAMAERWTAPGLTERSSRRSSGSARGTGGVLRDPECNDSGAPGP